MFSEPIDFTTIITFMMINIMIYLYFNSNNGYQKVDNKNQNKLSQDIGKTYSKWTEVKMRAESFPGMTAWVGSVNKQGNCLYFRWGAGPDNAILIDTGKIHDDNRIYGINNILYTNISWHNIQGLNQILNGRETITKVKNPATIYVPPNTKNCIDDLLSAMKNCNKETYIQHNVKENVLGIPILLGDRKNIRVTPFETYHQKNSVGYFIEFLKNVGDTSENLPQWNLLAAVTGETTIETYTDTNNNFLQSVPYLFTDITFFDKGTSIYESVVKGHIHLDQLNNFHLQNKFVIGYNFSDKYSKKYIQKHFSDPKYKNYVIACQFHN